MDPSLLSQLISPFGWALLSGLPEYDPADVVPITTRLRAEGYSPDLIAAALTQSKLRAKARAKFGDFANGMLFTADGLEQATRLSVAAQHAQRYQRARCRHVLDLTCGIGADAMAMAALGLTVTANDLDVITAAIATTNLRHFPEVAILSQDALSIDFSKVHLEAISTGQDPDAPTDGERPAVDGLFADPARRASGKRTYYPQDYSPNLEAVLNLRQQIPELGVKVGPGIPHHAIPNDFEAQWVSVDGSVVEAGLWAGNLATAHGHSALLLQTQADGSLASHRIAPTRLGEDTEVEVGPVAQFLWEPDGALIRSGLVSAAAHELQAHLVDPSIAYLTTDSELTSPLATGYRILDVLPFHVKKLRGYLAQRGIGQVTIKKRGTSTTPEQLRQQLALDSHLHEHATLVVTRVAGKHTVLIVERLMQD